MRSFAFTFVLPLLAAGCASAPPPPPFYLNCDVTRVVVLPPFNETIERDAWKTVWPWILAGVASRGYAVVPQADVEAFYRKNNFNADPAEIKLYKNEEIAREFGVDAVFYTNISKWSYKYVGVYSEFGCEAQFELVDGKSSETLWKTTEASVETSHVRGRSAADLVLSLIGVAGNAFLSSNEAAARRTVDLATAKLPLAGRDPAIQGTLAPPESSEKKAPLREDP